MHTRVPRTHAQHSSARMAFFSVFCFSFFFLFFFGSLVRIACAWPVRGMQEHEANIYVSPIHARNCTQIPSTGQVEENKNDSIRNTVVDATNQQMKKEKKWLARRTNSVNRMPIATVPAAFIPFGWPYAQNAITINAMESDVRRIEKTLHPWNESIATRNWPSMHWIRGVTTIENYSFYDRSAVLRAIDACVCVCECIAHVPQPGICAGRAN